MFLTALNSAGAYLWTLTLGGVALDVADEVITDSQGFIYLGGEFQNTVDFDPGPGEDLRTSNGWQDVFLMKLTPDGSPVWILTLGGIAPDFLSGLALDAAGNIYYTGAFAATVDFNPGPGQDLRTASGGTDIFLTKLFPDGAYAWTLTIGGAFGGSYPPYNLTDFSTGVSLDPHEHIFVAGWFEATVDFDPGPGTDLRDAVGNADVFLTKLNADGSYGWTYTIGSEAFDAARGVTTDTEGHVVIAGSYAETVDFDPGPDQDLHSSNGLHDVFVTKFHGDGSYHWTRTLGGTSHNDTIAPPLTDAAGRIYLTGGFANTVDFDPGPGEDLRTAQGPGGIPDAYVTTLHPDGGYGWTHTIGGAGWDQGGAVALDPDEASLVMSGSFEGTVDFDPGSDVEEHASQGGKDLFVLTFSLGYRLEIELIGSGQVRRSPDHELYAPGTLVTLKAVPDSGYRFDRWDGDLHGQQNPQTLLMDSDKHVVAYFVPTPCVQAGRGPCQANPVAPAIAPADFRIYH